jgi:hypothetical protein
MKFAGEICGLTLHPWRLVLGCALALVAQLAGAAAPPVQLLRPDPGALANVPKVMMPPPPAWIPPSSAPLWAIEEIAAELKRSTRRPPQLSYTVSHLVRPDHRWLVAFDEWFRRLAQPLKIGYVDEAWDCDNYARCFVAFADLVALQGGETRGTICVGWATVFNSRPFGGAPAGGAHAIVIVGTSQGLYVIEPQSGAMAPLHQYPNRDELVEINF